MAIGAVMVANVFTGLNTETWTIWVWVAIAVGPVLIWVYTVRPARLDGEEVWLIPSIYAGYILHHSAVRLCYVSLSLTLSVIPCLHLLTPIFSYAYGNE